MHEQAGRAGAFANALALVAEAKMLAGAPHGAQTAAERALAVAPPDDVAAYGRAALALGLRRMPGQTDRGLVSALEEALARLDRSGREDLPLQCALEARLGAALQPMVDPPRALLLARRGIDRARAAGDRALLAKTILSARPAFRLLEPLDERRRLDTELLALAESLGDLNIAALAHGRLSLVELERGDGIRSDLHLAEYERLAARTRVVDHWFGSMLYRSVRSLMCGDRDEALRIVDELDRTRAEWMPRIGMRTPLDPVTFMRHVHGLGRPAEDRDAVIAKLPPFFRGPLAMFFDVQLGHLDKLRAMFDGIARTVMSGPPSMMNWIIVAEASLAIENASQAEQLVTALQPYEDQHVLGTPMPLYGGTFARLLAGLAALQGERARAQKLYDTAIAKEEAAGARPFAERTRAERDRLLGGAAAPSKRVPVTVASSLLALTHEGDVWLVRFGVEEARVKDNAGMHYLAHLIAKPDVAVGAIELFATRALVSDDAPLRAGDAGPVLDQRAIAAYRERARLLRERLEEATDNADLGTADATRAELEQLEDELRSAIGLGGRSRRLGSDSERVRVNVTTRIRKAIDKLRERAPGAAHHLATTIRTGITCSYRPPPRQP
jgi:hypothetical protein